MGNETAEPRDLNHIWLRQSVTYTINGQTRTVEMALPLRPGATPDEVEALLDEADAGMRRLSRRLDAHLAGLIAPPAAASAQPERPIAPKPAAAEAARQPAPPWPAPATTPAPAARPPERRPAAAQPSAPAGPDLTIPEFFAQAAAIGLTQRQAMEKLGVRSLSGLNLREALESLRRKALLDGSSPAPASPAPASPAPASAPRPPAEPPLVFDEEEGSDAFASEPEMELSYPDPADLPDDDAEDEADLFAGESGSSPAPSSSPAPDLSALRRDARLTSAANLPAPAPRRASQPSQESGVAETPAPPLAPEPAPEEAHASPAERILAELRETHGGGSPVAHQRTAFKNVVIDQLGEKGAAALTKDIWNLTPAQLGPEQLDALIQWGKRDDFVEEAREVLRAARAAAQPSAPQEAPAAQEPPTPPARGSRSASRPRPASSAEKPRGDR